MDYEIVVIGTSAGGIDALKIVLSNLKHPASVPIVIVQHLSPNHKSLLASILSSTTGHIVKEADEKETIRSGIVYIAPPNYHLLIEKDKTFSLTVGIRVCYARPSIDLMFETGADAYREKLIGIVLTGANSDGAKGLEKIKTYGGYTIVQSPETAYSNEMPLAAIRETEPDEILDLINIAKRIDDLVLYNK